MKTIHPDYAAFLARLSSPLAAAYERREEPNLADLAAQLESLGDVAGDFGETLRQLRQRTDTLERRLARPGALQDTTGPGAAPELRYTVNGRPAAVLCGAEQIRTHYALRGSSAPGAAADVSVGDFVRGVGNLNASPEARAVLNTGTDADGGYMVPSRLMGTVLEALVPASSVLQAGAGILPLEDFGAKSFTLAATDTVPTAAWRAENGTVAESSPGFRAVQIVARSLSFHFKVSREWLADAVGVDQALTVAIAQAFAKELDRAALRGTGTAPEPRGIANTSGIIAVTNGANGASLGTTRYANLFSAVQGILEANGPMPTAAIMSPRSLVTLGALADTTNQPMQVPPMLQPMSMLHTSQIPNNLTVGTSTDCTEVYAGDFRRMVFAMRERMSIQRLDQTFATSGQIGFLCHVRADVGVLYPKAFALVTGVRA